MHAKQKWMISSLLEGFFLNISVLYLKISNRLVHNNEISKKRIKKKKLFNAPLSIIGTF